MIFGGFSSSLPQLNSIKTISNMQQI